MFLDVTILLPISVAAHLVHLSAWRRVKNSFDVLGGVVHCPFDGVEQRNHHSAVGEPGDDADDGFVFVALSKLLDS